MCAHLPYLPQAACSWRVLHHQLELLRRPASLGFPTPAAAPIGIMMAGSRNTTPGASTTLAGISTARLISIVGSNRTRGLFWKSHQPDPLQNGRAIPLDRIRQASKQPFGHAERPKTSGVYDMPNASDKNAASRQALTAPPTNSRMPTHVDQAHEPQPMTCPNRGPRLGGVTTRANVLVPTNQLMRNKSDFTQGDAQPIVGIVGE
ncbi:hypothetical protein LZ30DRAFT_693433 [Colletotrichum cereale]|nr:hypothetical protein LZ30DRAFT_693433 [Colletotrichum cereale]